MRPATARRTPSEACKTRLRLTLGGHELSGDGSGSGSAEARPSHLAGDARRARRRALARAAVEAVRARVDGVRDGRASGRRGRDTDKRARQATRPAGRMRRCPVCCALPSASPIPGTRRLIAREACLTALLAAVAVPVEEEPCPDKRAEQREGDHVQKPTLRAGHAARRSRAAGATRSPARPECRADRATQADPECSWTLVSGE